MTVAQFTQHLHLIPDVHSSNPVIGNLLFCWKDEKWRKIGRELPILWISEFQFPYADFNVISIGTNHKNEKLENYKFATQGRRRSQNEFQDGYNFYGQLYPSEEGEKDRWCVDLFIIRWRLVLALVVSCCVYKIIEMMYERP